MKTNKIKIKVSELKKQGFKKTSIQGLYITENGKGYNYPTQKYKKVTNGKITVNNKTYNIAKLVLETFCKIPVRSGQINFINGNKNDFLFSNLEYRTTKNYYAPNEADLIKCVRLYFQVFPKFNKKSFLFKYYLSNISNSRNFKFRTKESKGSILFFEWLSTKLTADSKSIYALSLKHGYTATNGKNEIYKYLNLLVDEILQDFEDGFLKIKEFRKKVRKKSNKQLLKEYTKYSTNFNKKIDKKLKQLEEENQKHDA